MHPSFFIVGFILFSLVGLGGEAFANGDRVSPASQSSPGSSASDNFQIPMNFEMRPGLGRELAPRFDYSVESNSDLLIAEKRISTRAFSAVIRKQDSGAVLFLQWPAVFLSKGEVTIKSGQDILQTWPFESADLKAETAKLDSDDEVAVLTKEFAIDNGDLRNLEEKGVFRVCIANKDGDYKLSFCLHPLKVVSGKIKLGSDTNGSLKVAINRQEVTQKGTVSMNTFEETLSLKVTFPTGASYDIQTRPHRLQFRDVKQDGNVITVRGRGGPPTGSNIRFDDGDDKEWVATINPADPILRVMGDGEIPFVHELYFFKALPTEQDRPYLHNQSRLTTYHSDLTLMGQSPRGVRVKSIDGKIKGNPETGIFKWQVSKLKVGEFQNRTFEAQSEAKTYFPYTTFYRGYPYELGLRLMGVNGPAGAPAILFHSEVAGGAWFEKAFSDSYWLSLRRWGVYARYFVGLNGADENKYSLIATDLKYRFTPGIWNEDESFGLALGAARFTQNRSDLGPLLGAGFFWGRKMPQFFDEVFNIVPWFRYPKWVDLDFVYYPSTMDSRNTVQAAYKLNFHGKMMITPRFFMEAGFGFMSFNWDYIDSKTTSSGTVRGTVTRSVVMSYGTGGFGLNF